MKKSSIYRLTLTVLLILTIAFIWNNSLDVGEVSIQKSDVIIDTIRPIIDPHENIPYKTLNYMVRKAAHLSEFALLGFFITLCLTSYCHKRPYIKFFLCILSCAAIDELIQKFTQRTSSIKDVLIDCAGGLLGFVLALLFLSILRQIKK